MERECNGIQQGSMLKMSPITQKTLFVLSGGGFPGLDIHAGIWMALDELGIVADEIHGTSAGALTGACNAAGWHPESFADQLLQYSDSYLRHERPFWKVRLPWIDSIHDNDHIASALEGLLPLEWSGFKKPFSAWAVNKRTGQQVNVARPALTDIPAESVLASMAISGLFPSVVLNDGNEYIDGGVRCNLPLPLNWLDYDHVYLCIAKPRPQDYKGSGVISNLIRNINIMMLDQINDILDTTADYPQVKVIWPDVTGADSMLRFNHNLIEQSYNETIRTLKGK